jgi:hypothetical protein
MLNAISFKPTPFRYLARTFGHSLSILRTMEIAEMNQIAERASAITNNAAWSFITPMRNHCIAGH